MTGTVFQSRLLDPTSQLALFQVAGHGKDIVAVPVHAQ